MHTMHKKSLLEILSPDKPVEMIRDAAREFAQTEIAPLDQKIDEENHFPSQLWQKLGALDLLGITIPEAYGGIDAGYLAHLVVMEEISRASGSVGLSYVANTNLGMNQIKLNGTLEQQEKFLPALVKGETHAGLAMSEPGAGSDVMSMQLRAEKIETGWILNGTKQWITNGGTADVLVVYGKTDPAAGKDGITAFLIKEGMPGFRPSRKEDKEGMRGSETWELTFENCFVPHQNVLGHVNKGRAVLTSGLNYERLMLSGGPIGLAQAAVDHATKHLEQRKQFGAPLIEVQVLAHEIARMQSRIMMSRNYAYSAAAEADDGTLTHDTAASVFFETSNMAREVTQQCVTLCGGMGYTHDLPVGRIHRDALLYEIGGGARHIRLMLIAGKLHSNLSDKFQIAVDNMTDGPLPGLHPTLRLAEKSLDIAVEHAERYHSAADTAMFQRLAELRSNLLMAHHYTRTAELVPGDKTLQKSAILEVNDIAVKIATECLEIAGTDNRDSTLENNLGELLGIRRAMGRRHDLVESLAHDLIPAYAKTRPEPEGLTLGLEG